MKAGIQIDTREFDAALNAVAQGSRRTFAEVVNGQALALAFRAIKRTKAADATKVAWRLGQIGTKIVVDKKTGKRKKGARIYSQEQNSLAARIVNARRLEKGQQTLHGKALVAAARDFIIASVRSVKYIRSGWLPAVRILKLAQAKIQSSVGVTMADGGKIIGREKGTAFPASSVSGPSASAEIVNRAGVIDDKHNSPESIAIAGLQAAMAESVEDMRRHAAERIQKEFDKHSAR